MEQFIKTCAKPTTRISFLTVSVPNTRPTSVEMPQPQKPAWLHHWEPDAARTELSTWPFLGARWWKTNGAWVNFLILHVSTIGRFWNFDMFWSSGYRLIFVHWEIQKKTKLKNNSLLAPNLERRPNWCGTCETPFWSFYGLCNFMITARVFLLKID